MRANKLLLDRILTGRSELTKSKKRVHSLNESQRKKEQGEIARDNLFFAERICMQRSVYKVKEYEQDFKRMRKLQKEVMQRHPDPERVKPVLGRHNSTPLYTVSVTQAE